MFGGYDGKTLFTDIEIFDIFTQSWHKIKRNSTSTDEYIPKPRKGHSVCVSGNKIYYYGGVAKNEVLNDLVIFDTEKLIWEQIKIDFIYNNTIINLPSLKNHSANFINNNIYLVGGSTGDEKINKEINLYRISLNDKSMVKVNNYSNSVPNRQQHSATIINNYSILIIGGYERTNRPIHIDK
jgi:N-acetylneuraminic acid mutarotase